MTAELMKSYNKDFYSDDETDNRDMNVSQSMVAESSKIGKYCSKLTNNDDSLERFLVENIANYETAKVSNLSSSFGSSTEVSSSSIESSNADKNNVDIPEDCRMIFGRMMEEIEGINRKNNYIMNTNKSLKEEIETVNFFSIERKI